MNAPVSPARAITVRVEFEKLEHLHDWTKFMGPAVELFISKLAFALKRSISKQAPRGKRRQHPKSRRPRRSLGLKQSVEVTRMEKRGLASFADVGPQAAHAVFVVSGTKPHVIQHRRAAVLTFFEPGARDADEYGFVHRKRVRHPGTFPDDFVGRGARKVERDESLIQRTWRKALKQARVPIDEAA